MEAVKTTQVDGDVSVGGDVALGGNATVQGGALIKGDVKILGWLEAHNIRLPYKGLFTSEDNLKETYRHPHDGWWAIVGDTVPGPIWVAYDDKWNPTGVVGGSIQEVMALQEAKEYADRKAAETLETAKGYTDEREGEIRQDYKAADAETLRDANRHADDGDAETLAAAKEYTDEKTADALDKSKKYTDDKTGDALRDAKAHSDAKDDEIRADYQAEDKKLRDDFTAADKKLREDFTAADTSIITGYREADGQMREDFTAADEKIENDYKAADAKIREDYQAADAEIMENYTAGSADTLAKAKEYADEKDAENLQAAKDYVGEKYENLLQSAKDYADSADETFKEAYKAADEKIREEYKAGDAETLAAAKKYAGDLSQLDYEAAQRYADEKAEEITEAYTTADAAITSELEKEASRAKKAEQDEATRAKKAEEDEKTRATGAETALGKRIDTETERATGEEEKLQAAITAEKTRATTEETRLDGEIKKETARATGAENDLDEKITAERERATGVETTLQGSIDTERSRATGREDEIEEAYKAADTKTLADARSYADEAVAGLVGSAPEALNTLEELANALGKNENFATTVSEQIGQKADKTALTEGLATKADKTHKHAAGDITSGTLAIERIPTGTTEDTVAKGKHTHSYSDITGAPSIPTVPGTLKNPYALTIKLNGGDSEGTGKFTYDGGTAKTVDITADKVGAAAKSHTHDTYATKTELAAKADTADVVKNTMTVKATGLAAGQAPTIAYDRANNTLTVGIPKGDKGDTGTAGPAGARGETGAAGARGADGTGIGTITVTSDGTHLPTPTCTVTPGTVSGGKQPFTLAFKGLQGAQGAQGATGAAGKSAYEIWKAQSGNGSKTETDFFASLKGEKGDRGNPGTNGATGLAAGFGTPTATVTALAAGATPTVSVTATGENTSKVFAFSFGIPAGAKGADGKNGTNGTTPTIAVKAGTDINTVGTPTVSVSTSGTTATITFGKLKGATGDTGKTGQRGSLWDVGTAFSTTGESLEGTNVEHIDNAQVGDLYLDPRTGIIYRCVTAGNKGTARWESTVYHLGNGSSGGTDMNAIVDYLEKRFRVKAGGYDSMGSQIANFGTFASAEGWANTATGNFAHAGGSGSSAGGNASFAHGTNVTASGSNAVAFGEDTEANGNQFAIGHWNVASPGATTTPPPTPASTSSSSAPPTSPSATGRALIVGNGTSGARSNAFRVDYDGAVYGQKAYNTSGADYAEYFEWADGNPGSEDRRGRFVTLDGDKIRVATDKDGYILGIVSPNPSVAGNSPDEWHARFLKDEWGNFLKRKTAVTRKIPDTGRPEEEWETVTEETEGYILNPGFDESHGEYVPRSERREWAAIGMLGVLTTRDDGTCTPDGCCKVGADGGATASDSGYRVLKRVNDRLVKVLFR